MIIRNVNDMTTKVKFFIQQRNTIYMSRIFRPKMLIVNLKMAKVFINFHKYFFLFYRQLNEGKHIFHFVKNPFFIKKLVDFTFYFSFHFLFICADRSFLVANAQSSTYHIIFCSDGFCKMTGFTRAEVMQRSSTTEFLHGPMTSQQAVNLIKEALSNGFEKHFEILYYRKDGK